jgi:tetratricopeptide (TPR) repeat protein
MILGQDYAQEKQYSLAIAELEKSVQLANNSAPEVASLACAEALFGHGASARLRLEQLKAQAKRQYVSPYYLAEVYSGLGDTNQAMDELENAYRDRSNSVIFLRVNPEFDILRSNPRFQALLRRIQL